MGSQSSTTSDIVTVDNLTPILSYLFDYKILSTPHKLGTHIVKLPIECSLRSHDPAPTNHL